MADPYQILGVPRASSAADIKSAYRKLAKKLHPDVNPGRKDIEQKFKEVTAAYDLLSDADKRARFDRGEIDGQGQERGFGGGGYSGYGSGGAWRNASGGAGSSGRAAPGSEDPFSAFGGMDDIFAEFMGGMRGGKRGTKPGAGGPGTGLRGSDVTYSISVTFAEACLGGKKRVSLANDKVVDITVPPGIEDGHKLRLKGQGLAGTGGAPGDAIVEIHIEAHPFFTRKDRDVYLDLPVSLSEAILGASVTVPTLDGQVAVKVPKNANSGTTLRLKGKGVTSTVAAPNGPPGDMFVKLRLTLPDPVPQDLSDFIEKWSKKNAYDPRKKAGLN